MHTKEVGVLLVLSALWGAGFLFIRIATPVLGPLALMAMRVLIAGLCLLLVALFTRTRLSLKAYWQHYLVIGIINAALPFTFIGIAELHLSSGLAALLNATTPLFGMMTAVVWMKETMTLKKALGLLFGTLGVVILVGWSPLPLSLMLVLAVAASLVAAASYGLASVYIKVSVGNKVSALAIATSSQFAAALFLVPLALVAPPIHFPTPQVWLSVVALALLSTAATLLLYIWLIVHAGPTKTLTVTFLAPLFGVLWGRLFLSEPLTWSMLLGLLLILLGAGLVTGLLFATKRQPMPQNRSEGERPDPAMPSSPSRYR